jgi:hypothetical protein
VRTGAYLENVHETAAAARGGDIGGREADVAAAALGEGAWSGTSCKIMRGILVKPPGEGACARGGKSWSGAGGPEAREAVVLMLAGQRRGRRWC